MRLRPDPVDQVNVGQMSLPRFGQGEGRDEELKSELSTAKMEVSRLSQSLNQKSAELMGYLSGSKNDKGQIDPISTVLKRNAHYLVFALIVVAPLILIAFAFRQSGGKLSGSISEIATSLEDGMRSLGTSNVRGEGAERPESPAKPPTVMSAPDGGASSVYQMKRVEDLRGILKTSISAETESQLTRWISALASDQAKIAKAVVIFELLQAETAGAIFKKLGSNEQDAIVKFMRGGEFPRPKVDIMIEAGEEILTRILADSLVGSRLSLKSDVSEKILQLSTQDLASVFVDLNAASHARLLLYMDSKAVNAVMKHLKRQNQDAYKALVGQLSRVPDAEGNTDADREILAVLDRVISKVKDDTFRSYMGFFQEIVEQADDEQKDDILSGIEAANPEAAQKLRRQVITFSTLFMLPQSVQNDIVAGMSNRELAALMIGLSNEDATNVIGKVSPRRKQIILDELTALQEGDQEVVRSSHKRAKDAILQKIRASGADLTQLSAAS
jgi:flagellar motor switch protein FliG